jgi:hypothetical protein
MGFVMKFLDLICIFFTFMVIILFALNFKIQSTKLDESKNKSCIAVDKQASTCWSESDRKAFCARVDACK